jgi:hypothetical protein
VLLSLTNPTCLGAVCSSGVLARKRWDNNEHYCDANAEKNDKEDEVEQRRTFAFNRRNEEMCQNETVLLWLFCDQVTGVAKMKQTILITKIIIHIIISSNNNSVALVSERTIWPRDRRLSEKIVPTYADRGVSRSERGGSPTAIISNF